MTDSILHILHSMQIQFQAVHNLMNCSVSACLCRCYPKKHIFYMDMPRGSIGPNAYIYRLYSTTTMTDIELKAWTGVFSEWHVHVPMVCGSHGHEHFIVLAVCHTLHCVSHLWLNEWLPIVTALPSWLNHLGTLCRCKGSGVVYQRIELLIQSRLL